MKFKRTIAGAAVAVLAVLGVGLTAQSASAHTGDLSVTAVCNTTTGQYDVTAKLTTANTGLAGTTAWRVGNGQFQGTPGNADGMQGAIASNGAQTITLTTFTLPGNTTGKGPWVYAFTKWTDGYGKGSDGQLLNDLKGDCKVPAPAIKEIPYPTLLATEVCGANNDTVYVDPAWVTQYGSLVNGPWIDTNYKQQNGKWVVDGSAQIKPEYRSTYIWAGTGGKNPSDFTRWQMYPGTSPFVHEDVATACPPVEVGPKHNANGEAVCGAYSITLYNKQSEGELNATASYVVYIDGKFSEAHAVAANEELTITGNFAEDSGNHQVIVRTGPAQGDAFVLSLDVTSDCIAPQPEDDVVIGEWSKPVVTCDSEVGDEVEVTREVSTTEYVLSENGWVPGEAVITTETDTYTVTAKDIEALDCAVVVPSTEQPKPTAKTAKTVSDSTLAATGGDINPWLVGGGLLALILGGLGMAYRRQH